MKYPIIFFLILSIYIIVNGFAHQRNRQNFLEPRDLNPPTNLYLGTSRTYDTRVLRSGVGLKGTLTIENDCIVFHNNLLSQNERFLLIIVPPFFFLHDNAGQLEIVDTEGNTVVVIGRDFIGGGSFAREFSKRELSRPIPEGCGFDGILWLESISSYSEK